MHEFLVREGVRVARGPEAGPWAPGYYSVLFEDSDGIRLEVNFVPGKGLFEAADTLPLTEFARHVPARSASVQCEAEPVLPLNEGVSRGMGHQS